MNFENVELIITTETSWKLDNAIFILQYIITS